MRTYDLPHGCLPSWLLSPDRLAKLALLGAPAQVLGLQYQPIFHFIPTTAENHCYDYDVLLPNELEPIVGGFF